MHASDYEVSDGVREKQGERCGTWERLSGKAEEIYDAGAVEMGVYSGVFGLRAGEKEDHFVLKMAGERQGLLLEKP